MIQDVFEEPDLRYQRDNLVRSISKWLNKKYLVHVSFVKLGALKNATLPWKHTWTATPGDSLHEWRIVLHIIDKAGLFFMVRKEACSDIVLVAGNRN